MSVLGFIGFVVVVIALLIVISKLVDEIKLKKLEVNLRNR